MSTHSIVVTTQIITFKHIIDDIILLLLLSNTDRLQHVQKLWQSLYYFYQIQTAFNKLKKIMSELVLLLTHSDRLQQVENYARCYSWTLKWAKLFTGFINQYLIDQSAALNVSTEPLKTLSTFCLTYCNIIINCRSQYWVINW